MKRHEVNFLSGVSPVFNPVFSFNKTRWLTETKESSQPYYLPIARRRKGIHWFYKDIRAIWNADNFVLDLNSIHQFHFPRP